MGTHSIIAKQIGEDKYLTIFCHYNGYPDDNGATLLKHYNTPERVDALFALGDLEIRALSTDAPYGRCSTAWGHSCYAERYGT